MHKKLRVGIVGAGSIVKQRHLPELQKLDNVDIVAVSNSTYESSTRFCAEYAPHATPIKNWVDLVALPDLDIIWIGTTPHLHAPVTISALEAGHHVFCQARMAMTLAEAADMLAAAESVPSAVATLCPAPQGMRWDAVVRDLLAADALGSVHSLSLRSIHGAYSNPDAPAHWRQRTEISGIQILTLGIHVEVLQRWFGDINSITAQGGVMIPARQGYTVQIPDYLQVQCHFVKGIHAVMEFSGIACGPAEDFLEISGTKARLRYDFLTDQIFIADTGSAKFEPLNPPENQAKEWSVEADFIAAVRGIGPRSHPDFEDGIRYMRVVDAVHRSLECGGVSPL